MGTIQNGLEIKRQFFVPASCEHSLIRGWEHWQGLICRRLAEDVDIEINIRTLSIYTRTSWNLRQSIILQEYRTSHFIFKIFAIVVYFQKRPVERDSKPFIKKAQKPVIRDTVSNTGPSALRIRIWGHARYVCVDNLCPQYRWLYTTALAIDASWKFAF